VTFIGFDSAWANNPKAPGAICRAAFDGFRFTSFTAPELVGFDAAAAFIQTFAKGSPTLLAIDQPTIVPNPTGMRPAERVAASVISWAGGGVQPANRGRIGMFDEAAPIWRFLLAIGAIDDPVRARAETSGLFVMECFPALALLSFDPHFLGRLMAPRYNPARKTFRIEHWNAVIEAVSAEAERLGCFAIVEWLVALPTMKKPLKADQDCLDAVICLLVAIRWRLSPPGASIMIGDLENGYIVAPASSAVRQRLVFAAQKYGVKLDDSEVHPSENDTTILEIF
jgi:predicted RNase H-like nuclease